MMMLRKLTEEILRIKHRHDYKLFEYLLKQV